MPKLKNYVVLCENIGTVHKGTDKALALEWFDMYVDLSKRSKGRASHEAVTMFCDDILIREFTCDGVIDHSEPEEDVIMSSQHAQELKEFMDSLIDTVTLSKEMKEKAWLFRDLLNVDN